MSMLRRRFLKGLVATAASFALPIQLAFAKNYLTIEQAKKILWPDQNLTPTPITLSEAQADLIEELADIRVRNHFINGWRSEDGGWFIVDQVIGKHENIDLAVAISAEGKVMGIEVLTYRETYGDQVMHPNGEHNFTVKIAANF